MLWAATQTHTHTQHTQKPVPLWSGAEFPLLRLSPKAPCNGINPTMGSGELGRLPGKASQVGIILNLGLEKLRGLPAEKGCKTL